MSLQLGENAFATIPLVHAVRGSVVEVVHRGALAVVDTKGRLIARAGDPNLVVHMRSSAKPFQLLPLVESGAADQLGLSQRELAVMAASHSGTDAHVETVVGILERLGLDEQALLCGVHLPIDRQAKAALIRRGQPPSPLHHNCSGKHTGMLAYAVSQGWSVKDYTNPGHPVQQKILQALAEMADWPAGRVDLGIDGCSVPVFAMPLRQAALAYARLADPSELPEPRRSACRRIVAAMIQFPDMVAGPSRFDTALMRAGAGCLVAKGGAQGYQGVGVLPSLSAAKGRPALGLALKIEDGDGRRAVPLAMVEMLRQLDLLEQLGTEALEILADYGPRPLYNYRDLPVGELESVFELSFVSLEPAV